MNAAINDMLRMMYRSGRQRQANASMISGLADLYEEAGKAAGEPVIDYLRALADLAVTIPSEYVASFVQGRVWCSVSVYAETHGKWHRVALGRARFRRVRGEPKIEWQLRYQYFSPEAPWASPRRVESLTDLIVARRADPRVWTLLKPPEPAPNLGPVELGDDVDLPAAA